MSLHFSVITSLFLFAQLAFANPGVEIDVKLSPAGSFTAKTSKVKGFAKQKGNMVAANQVLVDINSLQTGIELRDKHLKQRLQSDKFPTAKLVTAKGKDGAGEATLLLMGKQQKVKGTYTTKGNFLTSEFKLQLPALDIKDVKYMGVGVKDEVIVKVTVPVQQVPDKKVERSLSSEKK